MSKKTDIIRPESLAAQAGHFLDPESGAVVPAIHPATTFARDSAYEPIGPHGYSRYGTPAWDTLEATLAQLEEAEAAAVFASGLAAASAVVMTLRPGDHLIAHDGIYWAFRGWLQDFCPSWGIDLTLLDLSEPGALDGALRPGKTKLVWLETPSNPLWQVLDIAQLSAKAQAAGAQVAVDSTVVTPVLCRPLSLGADIVMHSATKYLNGHSDVLAGALVTADPESEPWQRALPEGRRRSRPMEPIVWCAHSWVKCARQRLNHADFASAWVMASLSAAQGACAALVSAACGREMVNRLPLPGWLLMANRPFCISIKVLAMAMPTPGPANGRLRPRWAPPKA